MQPEAMPYIGSWTAMMRVGEFVKAHIKDIFRYCEADTAELSRLMDRGYSKDTFGIQYPFCAETPHAIQGRYWHQEYRIAGHALKVCNDWYDRHRDRFVAYLRSKGIEARESDSPPTEEPFPGPAPRGRYRSYPIGNAQNGVIRNILSNIGEHAFSETDWRSIIASFDNRCAYCGEQTPLVMDHATPINKGHLGEHHLGNLVPSCADCNGEKGGSRDFIEFLSGNGEKIAGIIAHMERHDYNRLGEAEMADQIKSILALAHKEVSALAERYIGIIDTLLRNRIAN
jgi:hypothetical protein